MDTSKEILKPEIQKICDFLYDKIYTIIAVKEIIKEKNNREKKILFKLVNDTPDTILISKDIKSRIKNLYEENEIIDVLKKISNEDYNIKDINVQNDINFIKKIYEIVDEIKINRKNNEFIKLKNSTEKLLEEIFKYREVINALIIVFNFYYTNNFTKDSINEITRSVEEKEKEMENNNEEKQEEKSINEEEKLGGFIDKLYSLISKNKKETNEVEKSSGFMNKVYSLFNKDTKDTSLKVFKDTYLPFNTYYNIYYNKKIISEIFKRIKSEEKFKNNFVNMMKLFINNLIQICLCDKNNSEKLDKIIEKIILSKINKYINELKTNTA